MTQTTRSPVSVGRFDIFNSIDSLKSDGYGLVSSLEMTALLNRFVGPQWAWGTFRESWNNLGVDTFMADSGTYRRRSYSTFDARAQHDRLERTEPRPHFQSTNYNRLNGGIDRVFMQTPSEVTDMPMMRIILEGFRFICEAQSGPRKWHCQVHQFRITATAAQNGFPTPEGLHRDGVDWVLIMLIARNNISGGKTTILGQDGRETELTMMRPMSALLLNDNRVQHAVSSISPIDPAKPSYRDTLVVTLTGLD